jgi:hypothetical protein
MLPADNDVDLPGCRDVPKVAATILDFYRIFDVTLWLGVEHKSTEAASRPGPDGGRDATAKKISPAAARRH